LIHAENNTIIISYFQEDSNAQYFHISPKTKREHLKPMPQYHANDTAKENTSEYLMEKMASGAYGMDKERHYSGL
jgi:hypothetical protein